MHVDSRLIRLSDCPSAIAVSPSGDRVYMANPGEVPLFGSPRGRTVTIVDPNASGPDRRAEIGQVRVGRMPSGIAVDPGGERIYVANTGSHDVSVVDVQSAMQTARIKVGRRPVALAYVDQLYVAESATGTVSVVAPQGGQMLAKIATGNRPHSLVASWSGDRVYVLNKGDETVCAIDTRTRSVVASVAVGHAPVDMALDPSGTRLYVANQVSQSLTVIDTPNLEPAATIRLTTLSRRTDVGLFRDPVSPQPWAIGVSRDGNRLLVAFWAAGTLAIFDAHTGAHLAETQLDNARYSIGPNAIAADWPNRRLYVSCADHALVTVHDD